MIDKTTINYRIKDLRNPYSGEKTYQKDIERDLDIPASTLSGYEKSGAMVPHDAILKLAEYFNVSADYLLGITDCPDSVNTPISQLHLSDKAIERITSKKINPVLLSEMIENDAFVQFMIDAEVYVNGYVEEYTEQHYHVLNHIRDRVRKKYGDIHDQYIDTLDHSIELHQDFMGDILKKDLVLILEGIRNKHSDDPDTSDGFNLEAIKKAITDEAKKNPDNPRRGLSAALAKLLHIPNRAKNINKIDDLLSAEEPTEEQIDEILEKSSLVNPDADKKKK